MYKLVILIDPLDDQPAFDEAWPNFLHLVEAMPALRREATSQVIRPIFGQPYKMMHELFFDSYTELAAALNSTPGEAAGRLIQKMTSGHLSLFIAEHTEDDLENIRKYRQPEGSTE